MEISTYSSNLPGFSDIVLVSKKELEILQNRVQELLEANNREVQKRRDVEKLLHPSLEFFLEISKEHVKLIIQSIEFKDKNSEQSGSCGDGSFDHKSRFMDHQDRLTAIRVIKQDILGE